VYVGFAISSNTFNKYLPPASAIPMFGLTVPAILLLSLLPGPSTPHLQSLVEQAMVSLRWLEDTIIPPAWTAESPSQNFSISPNGVQELHQISAYEPVRLWGDSVESLWRVTMTFGAKRSTWGMLTSRLLMWRSMVGEKSSAGEWARREAIRNLGL
jgi:nucleolar pre-ribosomal-associated protein 1